MSSERIAIPTNDKLRIEEHIGRCRQFAIYTIEDGETRGVDFLVPPDNTPHGFPDFLREQGADTVIAGRMGCGMTDLFKNRNITVITGASGTIEDNLAAYLEGTLDSKESSCGHHEHQNLHGQHDRHAHHCGCGG